MPSLPSWLLLGWKGQLQANWGVLLLKYGKVHTSMPQYAKYGALLSSAAIGAPFGANEH